MLQEEIEKDAVSFTFSSFFLSLHQEFQVQDFRLELVLAKTFLLLLFPFHSSCRSLLSKREARRERERTSRLFPAFPEGKGYYFRSSLFPATGPHNMCCVSEFNSRNVCRCGSETSETLCKERESERQATVKHNPKEQLFE